MNNKNLLVQYKGGGYDGCFWEWNFFLFDSKGQFHNLLTSGYNGVKNEQEALNRLNNDTEAYKYILTCKNDILEFQHEVHKGLVLNISNKINEIYDRYIMFIICKDCESEIMVDLDNGDCRTNEYGDNYYCNDCYFTHSCGYCGQWHDDIEDNNVDDNSHCIDCVPDSDYNCPNCNEPLKRLYNDYKCLECEEHFTIREVEGWDNRICDGQLTLIVL